MPTSAATTAAITTSVQTTTRRRVPPFVTPGLLLIARRYVIPYLAGQIVGLINPCTPTMSSRERSTPRAKGDRGRT